MNCPYCNKPTDEVECFCNIRCKKMYFNAISRDKTESKAEAIERIMQEREEASKERGEYYTGVLFGANKK